MTKWLTIGFVALVMAFGALTGCDDDDEPTTECTAGEAVCTDEGALQTCKDDGTWGDPDPCPAEQMCMTMNSGLTHCMPMGMMEGDATSHDGMQMGDGMGMGMDGSMSMETGPDM